MELLTAGARGAGPGDSLQAMRRIYPRLQAFVNDRFMHGGASATTTQDASELTGSSSTS